jgi:hypothetical protein
MWANAQSRLSRLVGFVLIAIQKGAQDWRAVKDRSRTGSQHSRHGRLISEQLGQGSVGFRAAAGLDAGFTKTPEDGSNQNCFATQTTSRTEQRRSVTPDPFADLSELLCVDGACRWFQSVLHLIRFAAAQS